MTRINLVPPKELTRQHLIAEYRELPRIFTLVGKAITRGEQPNDPRNPKQYTLGTGHVRFFYNKLQFIANRQQELINEMLERGYKTLYTPYDLTKFPETWKSNYIPTEEALALNRARIEERLKK